MQSQARLYLQLSKQNADAEQNFQLPVFCANNSNIDKF